MILIRTKRKIEIKRDQKDKKTLKNILHPSQITFEMLIVI